MSRANATTQGLMPSILERLLDPDSMGTVAHTGAGLQRMIDAVRADLEELLNTRQTEINLSSIYPETRNSIVTYGMPDMTSIKVATPAQRDEVGKMIEGVVARFEPRLRDVRATLVAGKSPEDTHVRFHIEGRLSVDPAPEVAFETVLELMTGQASIKPSERVS